MTKAKLRRSPTDKMIAGVAGGMAEYFEIDPVFVRLGWVILGLAGIGIVLYIALIMITPEGDEDEKPDASADAREDDRDDEPPTPRASEVQVGRRRALFAAILVAVGATALLDNLNFLPWELWDDLWPVALIAVGLFLLLPAARGR